MSCIKSYLWQKIITYWCQPFRKNYGQNPYWTGEIKFYASPILSKIYLYRFKQKALDYIYIRFDKRTCSLRKPSSHSFQLKSYQNSVPQYIPLIKKAYFIFRFCSQFFWCHFRNLTQAEISWNKKPNYCLVFIWKKM